MKITRLCEHLSEGLRIFSHAVSSRPTFPALGNALLEANGDGRLTLPVTGLEVGINSWIGARMNKPGGITVPTTFVDLVTTRPTGQVESASNGDSKTLEVDALRSRSNVRGIDAQEFPVMLPPEGDDGVTIEADVLRLALDRAVFATATDSNQPIRTTVLAEFKDRKLTLPATDRYGLSELVAPLPEPVEDPSRVTIPAEALRELPPIVGAEGDAITILLLDGCQAIFHLCDVVLVAQPLEDNFVDSSGITPREWTTHTILNMSSLPDARKMARVFAQDASNINRLRVLPGESDLRSPGRLSRDGRQYDDDRRQDRGRRVDIVSTSST